MATHSPYLSDKETVNAVYEKLTANDLDGAVAIVKSKGDDAAVMNAWVAVQCDLNTVKKNPHLAEAFARPGVEFALEKGYKKGAAVLLHNLFAFHAPNWDEGVDPNVVPGMVEASRRQLELRKELDDVGSLGWAWWDLGLSELIAGNYDAAVEAFDGAIEVHGGANDADAVAWANLFKGKALIKLDPNRRDEGHGLMKDAADTILRVGAAWEKNEIPKIMASVE
jgi:tetratricopeptide (TPR) repeat protein